METIIKVASGICVSLSTYLWGGWSHMLQTLLIFVAIDYLTGVIAAGKKGRLSSQCGFWGIASKVSIFAIVAVANMIDQSLGDGNLFRDGTIAFYLANESLSIVENAGRMGLPVPEALTQAIKLLRGEDKKKEEGL